MKTPIEIIKERFGSEFTKEGHPCYFVAPNVFIGLMEKYAQEVVKNQQQPDVMLSACEHEPIERGQWYECSKCGKIL